MKSFKNIYILFNNLSNKRKIQVIFLMLSTLLSGILEALSLAAFLPFLTSILDINNLIKQPLYIFIEPFLNKQSDSNIQLQITLLFILITAFTSLVRILNLWYAARISSLIGSDIGVKVYRQTLYKPYIYHLTINSSSILNAVTYQAPNVLGVFYSTNFVITSAFTSLCIIIGLILIDTKLALSIAALVALIYSLISYKIRKYLIRNSKFVNKYGKIQIQSLQEGLGLIRDIILENSYEIFIKKFQECDIQLNNRKASSKFLSTFPRFLLESIALIFLSIIALIISFYSNENDSFIALFGTYALGAQRLISSSQQIYTNWSNIESKSEDINKIVSIIDNRYFINKVEENKIDLKETKNFRNSISLKNIKFKYPNSKKNIINDISLKIDKGEKIALIGSTGSGKSTLIDIIMGLLEPNEGEIKIDEKKLIFSQSGNKSNLISWRKTISHVPQSIFLPDTTFTQNIALGVPKELINFKKVIKAAKIACIHNFINESLYGYEGIVGERGVKISGGQRQRIGIARALYKNPKILILDEATSALDNITENKVMQSIKSSCKDMTIVMIAHRHSSIKNFDRVIKIEKGRIVNQGTPHEILKI